MVSGQRECFKPGMKGIYSDIITYLNLLLKRTLVSFGAGRSDFLPAVVRSAIRGGFPPATVTTLRWFPPLQDLPLICFISLLLPHILMNMCTLEFIIFEYSPGAAGSDPKNRMPLPIWQSIMR